MVKFLGLAHRQRPEALVAEDLTKALVARGWTVEIEAKARGMYPDVIAQDPQGHTYVFEVKTGNPGSSVHVSDIAQAAAFLKGLDIGGHRQVRVYLMTNLNLSESARELSHQVGVHVIHQPGDYSGLVQAALGQIGV